MPTLPWSAYEALDGERFSRLKLLLESPLHYRATQRADTTALALGRYVHAAILSPDLVDQDFAIYPGARRAGKEWEAFAAENAGKTIFRKDEIEGARPIIDAVRAHPEAAALLSGGAPEQVLQWTDPETGIKCKARPDYMHRPAVIDLKTTRSIDVRRFGHDIARYSYHAQLAHYADGIAAVHGWQPERHTLIAVEKDPPHDVAVFDLDADAIDVGRAMIRDCLALLAQCRATDSWPGRHPKRVTLGAHNLPPWMFGGGIPEFEFEQE